MLIIKACLDTGRLFDIFECGNHDRIMKYSSTKILASCLIVFFLPVHLMSCAQTKKPVHNTHAFFEQRFPGKLRVDTNGKPVPIIPDTTVIVYVETTAKQVQWEMAWQNGRTYSILKQQLVKAPFKAGKLYSEDRKITVFIEEGNYLWQLYLIKEPQQSTAPGEQVKENEILLKGKYKGRFFYQKTGKPVELEGIPSV